MAVITETELTTENRPLVARSLSGNRWQLRAAAERDVRALAQTFRLDDAVARVLAARGFDKESAAPFLTPRLRDQMPDPSDFRDMDPAAARLAEAVQRRESVAIFGDYDVDGATSGAVLGRFLRALGVTARRYVPDRLTEGYGPNVAAMRALAAEGVRLCLTVDCGTTAFEPLEAAQDAGMDVIVLDHHTAEITLPPAVAVVNPNRLDETSEHGTLAAVGVTFLFCVAVNRLLRQRGFFATRKEPDLLRLLDLVALGTVADVVPLVGLNRVFVAQGLEVLAQRQNVGLTALADVAGLKERPQAWHLGFLLGPRVNAGGRVGRSDLGTRLLMSDDPVEAQQLAHELNRLNDERRAIEATITEQALRQAEPQVQAGCNVLMVADESWHPGVIGIVAGRLKERYNLPTLVLGGNQGRLTGSGRSIKGVDLGSAVICARQAGLIVKGGGHAMAAGATLLPEQLEPFRAFLDTRLGEERIRHGADGPLTLTCDAVVSIGGASAAFITQLDRLAPFGNGNPEPRVMIRDVRVNFAKAVGSDGDHVTCRLTGVGGQQIKAIAFRAASLPHGEALLNAGQRLFHVLGTLRLETWGQQTAPSLQISDVADALGHDG